MKFKKIGILGTGFVGGALANNLECRGFDVVRYSLDPQYSVNAPKIKSCDLVFMCLPTPTKSGVFHGDLLYTCAKLASKDAVLAVKSTVPPQFMRAFGEKLGSDRVTMVPEFLDASTAQEDTDNPKRNIVGVGDLGSDAAVENAKGVLEVLPRADFNLTCTWEEACLVKYGGNCFFFMKNFFFNVLHDLTLKYGMDYETVRDAVANDPRIGHVHTKASDKGGRGAGGSCLVPGTKIVTSAGIRKIEDVKVGDRVLSHSGKFRRVTETFRREVDEPIYRIRGQGLRPFYLTDEHPIYSALSGREYIGIARRKLSNCRLTNPIVEFLQPTTLTMGDYLAFPRFSERCPKHIDGDLCRLAGYYVAEGSSDRKKLTFSFHIDEKEYHEDVVNLVKKIYGLKAGVFPHPEVHSIRINVYSTSLVKEFKEMFGQRAENKHFPDDWLLADDASIMEMLKGYCRGDGSLSEGIFTSATVSEKLNDQLRFMLYRLGINCNSTQHGERTSKDGQFHRRAYYIRCQNVTEIGKIADIVGFIPEKRVRLSSKNRDTCPVFKGGNLRPIRTIDLIGYSGHVYNLEVEIDHSYVGLDGTFHNCLPKDFSVFKGLVRELFPLYDPAGQALESAERRNVKLLRSTGKDSRITDEVYGKGSNG